MFAAVDTNFLLGLAGDDDDALDAVDTLRRRAPGLSIVATPTPLLELGFFRDQTEDLRLQAASAKVLACFKPLWGFQVATLDRDKQRRITKVGDHLRRVGLLPLAERHDSFILAEAALIEASLLITQDSELRGVDYPRLVFELGRFKLHPPVLATPAEIVHKFFQ